MYVIIDIETTGGNNKSGKITEIAAYRHDGTSIVDSFSTLVNPGIPIPPFVVNLTGITDEMVSKAPRFVEIADELEKFTANATFVAHNVNFDFSFIREEYRRIGRDYKRKRLCTVQLSREVFPDLPSYSLGKLTQQLGINLDGAHRAEADALATIQLFEKIIRRKSEVGLFEVNFGLQDLEQIDSPYISKEVLESIPDDCGVFKIFDQGDELVYVKRSSQILSALSTKLKTNGSKLSKELVSSAYRVDWEITGSPLLSQLLEAELVTKHSPVYNNGKFSIKAGFGLYKIQKEGKEFLALKRLKSRKDVLMVFSSFYEGIEIMRQLAEANDLDLIETNLGRYTQHQLHFKEPSQNIEDITRSKARYIIIDEAPTVSQRVIILVEDNVVKGYGLYDVDMSLEFFSKDDLHKNFEELPELAMVVRQYAKKNKFEKKINLPSQI